VHPHTDRKRHPLILSLTQITYRSLLDLPFENLLRLGRLPEPFHPSKDAQLRHQSSDKDGPCQSSVQSIGERQVQLFQTVEIDVVGIRKVFRVAGCECYVEDEVIALLDTLCMSPVAGGEESVGDAEEASCGRD
jgi:hypothetical protein